MKPISSSIIVPSRLVFIIWAVYFVSTLFPLGFLSYGLMPRSLVGAVGIITAPLLHGGVAHLVSNTMPLLILGTVLYMFYDRIASRVFLQCYFLTGVLVWLFGRPFYHIGASGLIYGLAAFLMFFGLFRRDFQSLLISIVIVLFYGSIFYGVLPNQSGVSWESHLCGGIVGFFNAVNTSAQRRVSNY